MTTPAHNPLNGVTAAIWTEGAVVHKVLTRRREAPAHWAASSDPRHWNYWKREALAYATELPARLGLGAPRLLGIDTTPEGDIELRLEQVTGRHAGALTVDDLEAVAEVLGRAQGRPELPDDEWLSRGFLRTYGGSRAVDGALLDDDDAWNRPLMREHFGPDLRQDLIRLHAARDRLLALSEALPRTVCHLDVWPNNVIRRPGGEVVFLDWAFAGDGAIGEDVGNLVPDAVFDLLLPHDQLDELDTRLTRAYVDGLRDAGWTGDERLVRLGICASAVKYDWLTAYCLEHASAAVHLDYGRGAPVGAGARYAARAAGLALCARWAREAEALAGALGLQ
ncbi:MAG TPA: phosphotransferase [Solirubrobacteraceae bacterium]